MACIDFETKIKDLLNIQRVFLQIILIALFLLPKANSNYEICLF